MKAALLWTTGLTASLGAHAALFAFLALATEPDPLVAEPTQSGKIKMTSYEVPQSKAAAQEAKGEAQEASAAQGQAPGQGPVRSDTASIQPLPSERPSALTPDNTAITEIRNETVVEASISTGAPAQATTPLPTSVLATAPNAGPAPASSLITEASAQISADGAEAQAKAPPAQPAPSRIPDAPTISAATGWSGDTTFDPTSLAAIQSFMQPLDASQRADTPRDAISQLLASVPCARLAATFIPETGTLELRGHIPDNSIRAPILAAIQQQLGESIPVGGSMLVLPSPQCDVLSRVESLGLPQSQGQQRDAKELGAITQLSTFDYSQGERVIVRMHSPDYPAYVYVDFFDVDGRVLHLRPNQWEGVELHAPDTPLEIGADRGGRTSVKLIVQPPYGQELAIAYASSAPLYEGLRDTIEPAEPYLDFMRERIAALKAEDPDYRGEWVYMFIQTRE